MQAASSPASFPTSASAPDRRRFLGFDASIVGIWLKRHRARRELASLRDDQLRDAGLDRFAVRAEARKPFWKP
ncbi:DUF1127 domain-containing protein [Methylobacterium sp. WL103]|uniref:DUF1127 domain-containing protein n=1 Tax=unclassified Methylobacterium TaxID=2615210 RepID=UPI0011CB5118|nr:MULTISPECIES: DUF1127 domain-containing protein [unclassified Methylobacterium]TXM75652.1 DUF1127 domain-containing protein [Methylobacterium sp. WL12]TXM94922.1 DUF1127 domain-containing protein [Methylobacterium sp. WL103]